MKKKEAEMLAKEKVDIIMEYITDILEKPTIILAKIDFSSIKIEGQNMTVINMHMPTNNFEKHLNLGITSDHTNVIFKEFLNRIITNFLPHKTIGATRFYMLRSNNDFFDGIKIVNANGTEIKVNMYGIDKNISDEYNFKYEEYIRNTIENDREELR